MSPKAVGVLLLAVAILVAIGVPLGWLLEEGADDDDTWPVESRSAAECAREVDVTDPAQRLTIADLPPKIETDFGYGRGTRVIAGTIFTASVAVPDDGTVDMGAELPDAIAVELLTLQRGTDRAIQDVAAIARRIGSTQSYQLSLCIDTSASHPAGTFTGRMIFASDRVVAESTPVVEARLQSQSVPYMLTVALPLAVLLGLLYTALVLVRQQASVQHFRGTLVAIRSRLLSINGVFALFAAVIGAFGSWQASCNANPTWGQTVPQVILTVVAMAGAAAAGATVPLGVGLSPPEGAQGPGSDGPDGPAVPDGPGRPGGPTGVDLGEPVEGAQAEAAAGSVGATSASRGPSSDVDTTRRPHGAAAVPDDAGR